ncbi:PREDICTED: DNA helicase MCM9-like isoform X1 [Polistes dominula]|uniref:DNA helicase MCM9 n=1 Tax=Polistes dominula TaxID=743375 RepID=A0ABM1JDI6_POLDO|nr:PREDICTED: DNA helicase MCM9-like isoform X1 [Polistes dominula]
MLEDYLINHQSSRLEQILNATEEYVHYSIYVNFVSLFEADPENAQKILLRPRYYLPLCDEAAIKAQEKISKPHQVVKKLIHIRITAIPIKVQDAQIGELVTTSGITVRTSQPSVIKLKKRYKCKKCKHVSVIKFEWERHMFQNLKECQACRVKKIETLTDLEPDDCSDYQEIKIQEHNQKDAKKSCMVGLQVILLDDLVDKCRPGDSLEISGVIIRKWGTLTVGRPAEATTLMIANSISIRRKVSDITFSNQEMQDIFKGYWQQYENDPLTGRDNILASICPQLYGMYTIKLALAVVLSGGVSKVNDSGTRVRGEPHLLMIGDPGTGKSQLLRIASKLSTISVHTTGIGTTAAGLTAAAVKDTDGWHLEGGALVLADGGVCCIDEFNTMSSHDRACVHEAMEQQTISIAKAGLVSTLNSRCTVIAAINPDGGTFIDGEEWKTRLGNPLLSRFDLILLLKDNKNQEWDKMASDHILRTAYEFNDTEAQPDTKQQMDSVRSGLWSEQSLREYFTHIHTLKPSLTIEAEKVISATYLYHRSNPSRRSERTTVRLLDSLVRLAEGHARLMFRSEVQLMDAIIASDLTGTLISDMGIGCPFPTNPKHTYHCRGKEILRILNLETLESFL